MEGSFELHPKHKHLAKKNTFFPFFNAITPHKEAGLLSSKFLSNFKYFKELCYLLEIVGATGWSPNSIMQQFPKGRPAGRPYS
ncbi:MAG: hypothetical protein HQK76_06575 [Desulfobacterales bacterium]|nr:hypothetical protein [Desulfobacterales bacterium]